jgi:hypothetical protein
MMQGLTRRRCRPMMSPRTSPAGRALAMLAPLSSVLPLRPSSLTSLLRPEAWKRVCWRIHWFAMRPCCRNIMVPFQIRGLPRAFARPTHVPRAVDLIVLQGWGRNDAPLQGHGIMTRSKAYPCGPCSQGRAAAQTKLRGPSTVSVSRGARKLPASSSRTPPPHHGMISAGWPCGPTTSRHVSRRARHP